MLNLNQPPITKRNDSPPNDLLTCNIFDSARALLDEQGIVVDATPEFSRWLSVPTEPKGKEISTLLASRCAQWEQEWRRLSTSRETFARTKWSLPEDGASFDVKITRHRSGSVFEIAASPEPLGALQEDGGKRSLPTEPARRKGLFRLMRASEQLQNLVQRWPGTVFSQRPDFSFYFISPKIESLTGFGAAELETDAALFWKAIHPEDQGIVREQIRGAANSAEVLTAEFRIQHVNTGKISYVQEQRQAVKSRSGLLLSYDGVWTDVTREKVAEKRLLSGVWNETLSGLTSGITHEFRNVMSVVITVSELCMAKVGPDDPLRTHLSMINSRAWQATESLKKVAALYQGQPGEWRYADVNQVAAELAEVCQKLLSKKVIVEQDLLKTQLPVFIEPFELRQAVLIMTAVARDAMPKGGTLKIETSRHETLPDLGKSRGKLPRLPAICITVRDTGAAMSKERLDSIFDPFFVRENLEKSSGLGLYPVSLFAVRSGGAVSIQTTPGQGSCISLWLPEADFTEADRAHAPSAVGGQPAGPVTAGRPL